ncbi:hypothetical protein IW256_002857 [Actinomadura viridis]|uniref:Uncharacterized protein n=1 Tax=Actinomadura viridis TaxID=58110 RepID=A0A931GQN7_9ACTN|nr:hypothetical protein [Actinomadura viridis]
MARPVHEQVARTPSRAVILLDTSYREAPPPGDGRVRLS